MGRPTSYTQKMGDEICERIASGETLVTICAGDGMPGVSTVLGRWLDAQPEFAKLYARAKLVRIELMAEEVRYLSDTCKAGEKVKRTEVGKNWTCSGCKEAIKWQRKIWVHEDGKVLCAKAKAIGEPVYETETVTGDMIERAKLQVDTRKWLLSKLAAKVYGDRLELAGDQAAPIVHRVEFVNPKREEK